MIYLTDGKKLLERYDPGIGAWNNLINNNKEGELSMKIEITEEMLKEISSFAKKYHIPEKYLLGLVVKRARSKPEKPEKPEMPKSELPEIKYIRPGKVNRKNKVWC